MTVYQKVHKYDIVIVGGGLVGASLATAIRSVGFKILIVEAFALNSSIQPSYDERTVALTESTRRIFKGMGIWNLIKNQQIEAIKDIHISNKGHFGMTHLSHSDVGIDALGYVVPTRIIGRILWKTMKESHLNEIACPARAVAIEAQRRGNLVKIKQFEETKHIICKLVVVADGGRSVIRNQFVDQSDYYQYKQTAILSIVYVDRLHNGRAYERFTQEGPIALLPSGRKCYATIWTTDPSNLKNRLSLNDNDFIQELQDVFGDRAGQFSQPSPRKSYSLTRQVLESPTNHHIVCIGNAAHSFHPIAGQGFNLGLRDVSTLAEIIYNSSYDTLGSADTLNKYRKLRQRDTKMVNCFVYSLINIFLNDLYSVGLIRNIGLASIETFPPLKRFLLNRTMGLVGKKTRLDMGLPILG